MATFAHTNSYPADPAAVRTMLLDQTFREEVSRAQDAEDYTVSVTGDTVRIEQKQSAQGVPSFAKKIAGEYIELVYTEAWTSPTGGEFSMEIPGRPGHVRGTITLEETSGGTDEVFSGEVKVNIPLVGGKLEKLIADIFAKALRQEGRSGAAWLRG